MRGSDVVALFLSFASAGVRAWAGGGWAVDAVAGRQTRSHRDLDLAVDARDVQTLLDLLGREGFVVTVDWLPSRVELTAPDGRIVDVHPVAFAEDGSGIQAGHGGADYLYPSNGFTTGTIEGQSVPCLSIEQQLTFREGYPKRPVDDHDVRVLKDLLSGR